MTDTINSPNEIDEFLATINPVEPILANHQVVIQGTYLTAGGVERLVSEWSQNLLHSAGSFSSEELLCAYLRPWNWDNRNDVQGRLLGEVIRRSDSIAIVDSYDETDDARIIFDEIIVKLSEHAPHDIEPVKQNTVAAAMWRTIREMLCDNTKRFAADRANLKKFVEHSLNASSVAIGAKYGVESGFVFYGLKSFLGLAWKLGVTSICESDLLPESPKKPRKPRTTPRT